VAEPTEEPPSPARTISTAVVGGAIGYLANHIVNPFLQAHFGFQIPDEITTSLSAAYANKVAQLSHAISARAHDYFANRDVERKYIALYHILARLAERRELTGIGNKLNDRLNSFFHDWRSGMISTAEFDARITEIYDDYLRAIGEKPVSR
jgi:hypothetical protein